MTQKMLQNRFECRRTVLAALAGVTLLGASGAYAKTDAFPNKPIQLMVAFPPGGPTDTVTRIIGQRLSERLQQSVIIDNKSGASGTIGTAQLAKATPDGHGLTMLATPTLLAPFLYQKVGFDMKADLAPVALVYELPIVIVVNPKSLPDVTDLRSMIAHAQAQKVPLNYTSAGIGSFAHLSMELLKQMAKFDMQHIPYKGSVPAVTDLIGGQVPIMFSDLIAVLPHIQSGRLRAIAVGSPQRVSMLPDVPTIAEQGIAGYSAVSWGGLLAPAKTPAAVVEKLATEMQQILAEPGIQEKLLGAGAIAHFEDPATFKKRIHGDYDKWGQMVKALDLGFRD